MVKRLIAGALVAVALVGCGGGGGGGGAANMIGVNACPGIGGATITANGTVVLNNAAFATASSSFIPVGSATAAQVFLTNSGSQQLASGTVNLLSGGYYTAYAYGSATNQFVIVTPTDVSAPNGGQARLIFSNTSIVNASCDVYVTTLSSLTGLTPTITGLTPFNSGFQTEVNNVTPSTYNVFFTAPGNQNNILVQTTVTPAANTITTLGITDNGSTTAPFQQALPAIIDPVISGAVPPLAGTKNMIIKTR